MALKTARAVWLWLRSWPMTWENNLFRWFLRHNGLPHRWLMEWNASLNIRTIKMWDSNTRDLPGSAKGQALVEELRRREEHRGNL